MSTQRKAFTLIETLVSLTLLSAIFGTMLMTLFAMKKTSHRFSEGLMATSQLQRFAVQLRGDAHQAQKAVIERADAEDSATVLLTLTLASDHVVEYRLTEDRIERQVHKGQAVTQHESFSVSPVLDKGWAVDRARPFPLLSVYLNRTSDNKAVMTREPIGIHAALRISTPNTSSAVVAESQTP